MENSLKPVLRHAASLSTLIGDGERRGEWSIACWLKAATPGRELFICPEQLPCGYTLSVFGDRWQDVHAIRQAVDRIWRGQIQHWRYGARRTGTNNSPLGMGDLRSALVRGRETLAQQYVGYGATRTR